MTTNRFLMAALALCLSACGSDMKNQETEDANSTAAETAAPAATTEPLLARRPSAEDARVFIVSPSDGATVSNPVEITFGIEGMSLAKAGDDQPNSGHHHLIIDAGLPELSLPIPANENYVHYGDASTSTTREFEPGTHTLQLLLGDYLHIPHDPPVASEIITIHVE